MATFSADKFETVKAGDGFALAVARIEGPVMGFARGDAGTQVVRPGDQVVNRSGAQLYPQR